MIIEYMIHDSEMGITGGMVARGNVEVRAEG